MCDTVTLLTFVVNEVDGNLLAVKMCFSFFFSPHDFDLKDTQLRVVGSAMSEYRDGGFEGGYEMMNIYFIRMGIGYKAGLLGVEGNHDIFAECCG